MTSSSQGPRPVGPPPPPGRNPTPPGRNPTPLRGAGGPGGPPWEPSSARPEAGGSYRMRSWSWSSSDRPPPWFAILLLVLGVGLLIELLVPDLSFGSLLILAAGLAFGAAWLVGRVVGATVPALVLTGWGLAGVGSDLGILSGDGWGSLFIGIGFLIGWALGRVQGVRREWALVVGLVLGVIGLADVSDRLPFDIDAALVIPVAMIAVGIYLIVRSRMPSGEGS